jgi:hypothetical protein
MKPIRVTTRPIALKLQRLHALRLERRQLDDTIRALEIECDVERDHLRDRAQQYTPPDARRIEHIETPAAPRAEQDLTSWARRLRAVEDL